VTQGEVRFVVQNEIVALKTFQNLFAFGTRRLLLSLSSFRYFTFLVTLDVSVLFQNVFYGLVVTLKLARRLSQGNSIPIVEHFFNLFYVSFG
jgi:hypothetical protein